jgi:hypothetical protein
LQLDEPSFSPTSERRSLVPNGGIYPSARHGTGVAGIILGQADPLPPHHFPEGHASEAKLLSFAITNAGDTGRWFTSDSTVMQAVEALQTHMLLPPPCISFELWPDPDHPTQTALDRLEREFDVLVVTLAGNESDATTLSPGYVNGLTVGNVHRFSATRVVIQID